MRATCIAAILLCSTSFGQGFPRHNSSSSGGGGGTSFWTDEGGGVIDYLLGDVGIAESASLILDNDTGAANTIKDDSAGGFKLSSDAFGGSANRAFTLNSTAGTGKNIALFQVSGSTKFTFSGVGKLTLSQLASSGLVTTGQLLVGSSVPSNPGTHQMEVIGIPVTEGAMKVISMINNPSGFLSCLGFGVDALQVDGGVPEMGGVCVGQENSGVAGDTASFAGIYTQTDGGTPALGLKVSSTGDAFSVAGANPIPAVHTANHSSAQAMEYGASAATANVLAVSFSTAFSAAPTCICTIENSTASACSISTAATTTGVSFKGGGGATDKINWSCIGNR